MESVERPLKLTEISDGFLACVSVSNFMSLLTGAYKAGFDNKGTITIIYEDGEKETVTIDIEESQKLYENAFNSNAGWCDLIGKVQSFRG